jgi:hypothetical protein
MAESAPRYQQIPPPERRMNVGGREQFVEAISNLQYHAHCFLAHRATRASVGFLACLGGLPHLVTVNPQMCASPAIP